MSLKKGWQTKTPEDVFFSPTMLLTMTVPTTTRPQTSSISSSTLPLLQIPADVSTSRSVSKSNRSTLVTTQQAQTTLSPSSPPSSPSTIRPSCPRTSTSSSSSMDLALLEEILLVLVSPSSGDHGTRPSSSTPIPSRPSPPTMSVSGTIDSRCSTHPQTP